MQKTSPLKGKRLKTLPAFFFLLFSFLALLSVLTLDYFNWQKGDKSLFFSLFEVKKKVLSSQERLREIILTSLTSYGITSHNIQEYRDKKNILHLKVELSLKKYIELEDNLKKELEETSISVLKKDEHLGTERDFYLWEIEAKDKENLIILFSCYKEKKESLEKEKDTFRKPGKNKVAIIIDDMGYSLKALKEILSMKEPFTISILPFSLYDRETALIAHENGLEIMLHLPLQSTNDQGKKKEGGLILSEMSEEEVKETLEENLNRVPYIIGVNNHEGSKITADKILMRPILEGIKEMNLFFIDSMTTSKSIAFSLAQEMGIPSARRHVFLDFKKDENYIKGKMIELLCQAQEKGYAIGICHPSKKTLRVLRKNIYLVKEYNSELVFASQIVR